MKKTKWIRVSFNKLSKADYKPLMAYVKKMTDHLGCKFFFLFEPKPQFMLQLDYRNITKVRSYIYQKIHSVASLLSLSIIQKKEIHMDLNFIA